MISGISVIFLLFGSSFALGEVIKYGNLFETLAPSANEDNNDIRAEEEISDYKRCDSEPCTECTLKEGRYHLSLTGKNHECAPRSMGNMSGLYLQILDKELCHLCDYPVVIEIEDPKFPGFPLSRMPRKEDAICEQKECQACLQERGVFTVFPKPQESICFTNPLKYANAKFPISTKFSPSFSATIFHSALCPLLCRPPFSNPKFYYI